MIDPRTPEFKQKMREKRAKVREALAGMGHSGDALEKETDLTMVAMIGEYGKRDFFFFMDAVLDCAGMSRGFHGELCDFMSQPNEQKLVLAPRGHLKSTVCTVGYALWRIVQNPNIRILIANYKLENAKAFLYQIRNYFTMSEMFEGCYYDIIPDLKKVKWNESGITVLRTSNPKEATIEVTGVGGEITGRHYDLIIYDDIVGPENVGTRDQLEKLRNWYNQTQFLLDPGGQQVLIGTRWHFDDLYGFIMENLTPPFEVFRRGIYLPDRTPLWPEKFTAERIQKLREQMEKDPKGGKALFVAQYLNEVIDEATAPFKREFLTTYEKGDIPPNLAVSITVDPAISDKESADFAAVTVRGVDERNRWWLLDAHAERGMSPTALVDLIFQTYIRWTSLGFSVDAVAVESVAYQKSIQYLLRDEMFRTGRFLPLVDVTNYRASKEYRIKGLIPRWEQGAILIPRERNAAMEELLDEMFRFPKSKHDDVLDSLAMHDELTITPSARRQASGGRKTDRYGYPVETASGSPFGFFL